MIKIGILGDIGSGKSFVSKQFGLPIFNADKEVKNIYNYLYVKSIKYETYIKYIDITK